MPDSEHNTSSSADILRVSIKTAEFSEANANGWFLILESQFRLFSITVESTKFYHCLTALPASVVKKLFSDVIAAERLDKLKKTVLNQIETSIPELFKSLKKSELMTGRSSA